MAGRSEPAGGLGVHDCPAQSLTFVLVNLCIPNQYLFVFLNPLQLDNLPENSPINIVQTPIPITTSVPKRAKSQRKKALAAALATAQEYSEISMEQKKLQVKTFTMSVSWSHNEELAGSSFPVCSLFTSLTCDCRSDIWLYLTGCSLFLCLPCRRQSPKQQGRRVRPLLN